MQITETYQLTEWIKREIEAAKIVQKFAVLVKVLTANTNRQNNQPAQPFEDQKNALIKAIIAVNVNSLTLSQMMVLDKLKIDQNIGNKGQGKLTALLANTLDISHVLNQITTMQNEIQAGIQSSNTLQAALAPFVEEEKYEIPPGQVLTRVIFKHGASVENVKELREWTNKWFEIGRGFAVANGQTPEDVLVIGGARGSLIIELALLASIALPMAKAINLTLDSMVKYKDYQLKAFEVRQLKEGSPNLAVEFEEDAKRWEDRALQLKKETAEEIAENVKQYFPDYKEENQAELGKAVKNLVDFIAKGGDVDCVVPDETNDEETPKELVETMKLLKADFSQIRELKETLLLEHDKGE